ncbi:hypothetical protein BGZ97_010638 [Linnemannia gamsii]|uniref:NACHT domain-containing protein n=1 Tax=Linnemannia gamsii TaxID=64522 RepID=A0A9P6R990_9FUNG|nr:hypothetical protein BGZ97_010638 [Linnemannia gamsii]
MTAFDSTGASTFATVFATTSRIPLEGHCEPPSNATTSAQTGLDRESQANKDERSVRMLLEKILLADRPAFATGDLSSSSESTLGHFHLDISTDIPTVPVLDQSLGIPEVESRLDEMRRNILEDWSEPIYVPLRAKANPLASGKKSFLLTGAVHEFLKSNRQVFLLLGDSGSGKSTFCRQFVRELWGDYKHGGRIPLYVDLRETGDPMDKLIETCLQESGFLESDIGGLLKRRFVLVCDGYDESRLVKRLYTKRLCQLDVKMIVSCRNTYLGNDYQGRFRPFSDNKYNDNSSELFQEATIVPFSESDIKDYVKQHVDLVAAQERFAILSASSYDDIWNKLSVIPNLMNLVSNPYLLTLALKALPSHSIEALQGSELEAVQHDLYDGFMQEWSQVNQRRLERAELEHDVYMAFDTLLNDGFVKCVIEYSKNLADAIFLNQDGAPVVKFSSKHKEEWKVEFFGPEIRVKLLREASPLTRAGIRHWFIHKSLLDYLYSRTFYDPDDSDDYYSDDSEDSEDSDDDPQGDGDEYPGGGGNSFGGDGDGLADDSGTGTGGDGGATSGSAGLTGNNGGSSGGNGGSSGGNNGSSSGNHGSASSGGNSAGGSSGGSCGGNGDGSHGDKNDSNGDEDGYPRRKDDTRSKREGTSTKSRPSPSSNPFSKRNLFKEPSVLQFLVERARSDPRLKKRLFSTIKQAKSSSVPCLAAANAITILVKSGEWFQEVNLNGVYVPNDYMPTESTEPNLHAEPSLTGGELVRALMAPVVPAPTPSAPITRQDPPPLTSKSRTAKKKSHTNPLPIFPEGFMEELVTKLGSRTANHPKNLNSEPSDMNESEKATESEHASNHDSDDDPESEAALESADEYVSAADESDAEYGPGADDGEHHSSPSAPRNKRVRAAVENIRKQSIFTGVTTVVLIGNPSVGKNTTAANLERLQDQLSNGGSYVLFFVVAPGNGRVGPSDLALILLVLRKLQKGPMVGLILTQIPDDQIMYIQDPKYTSAVVQVLKKCKAKTTLLEQKNMLVLPYLRTFNDEEKQNVIDYVLSFEPKQVKIRRLALRTFEKFEAFFREV